MPLHILISFVLAFAQAQPPGIVSPAPVLAVDQLRLLDAEIVADLLVHDLEALIRERQAWRGDVRETIKRLNLCLRAGRRLEAASLVDHLGALAVDGELVRAVLGFLIDRREVDLAVRLIERVPGSGRELASNIVGYWLIDARKPPEEIDRWLADRGWTDDRISLNAHMKTDGPLMERIVADARSQACTPTTLEHVLALTKRASTPVNLDWIPAWCQTPSASDASDLAERAASWQVPAVAAVFFERALAMPFTQDDVGRETRGLSIVPIRSDAEWERRFRARTRLALAEAYRASGDTTRAQMLLGQLTSEDRSMIADQRFAGIAGQVQSDSGARPVEQAIHGGEPTHRDSRDYWLARARYFAARSAHADATDAFERALKIARTEATLHATRLVLSAYDEYLTSTGARPQAWRLLRRELEAGADRERDWFFDRLGRHLRDDHALAADSEWIWTVLERRADWEPATSLLEHLVRAASSEKRSAVVNRSLALVSNGDRQRALPLARALRQAGEGAAAVPLFERVRAQLPEPDRTKLETELSTAKRIGLRQQFQAELRRDDWRGAEQTWTALLRIEPAGPQASFDLSSTSFALVQLAEAAARRDDGADALRFWRLAANVDRTAGLEHLGILPLARYRAELTAFYQAMAQREPGSWVPAAALEKLRR